MARGALTPAGTAQRALDLVPPGAVVEASRAAERQPRRPRVRRASPDALAVALLVLAPLLGFGLPAFLGHPLLTGDNLIQNEPLRALVGRELAQGHLPLWNADTWSGTALLGGVNAGAAYPTTWLFAILPGRIAWGLLVWVAYALGATGVYAYCRGRGRSALASSAGAVAFGFSGFLLAQGVHIELVQAWSTVPWGVVALDGMARARGPRRWAWVGLLAASMGLTGLAGSPEALAWGLGLVVVYACWLVAIGAWPETGGGTRLGNPGERARLGACAIAGLAMGAALSAAQWLPAKAWIDLSQRSSTTLAYFTSGSIDPRLLLLAFDPFLFGATGPVGMDPAKGATGPLGLPAYFGTFNLPEISLATGLVVLVAVSSLLSRWSRDPDRRQWRIWAVLGGVELVVALGSFTPLAHLLYLIPLVHSLRLPNRALGGTDLAMAILFAWWVDRALVGGLLAADGPVGRRLRRAGAAVLAIPVLLAPVLLLGGASVLSLLSLQRPTAKVAPFTTASDAYASGVAVLALVLALVVLGARRLGARRATKLLGAVFVLQVATFGLGQDWASPAPGNLVHVDTQAAERLRALAGGGRVAIVDPSQQDVPGELALGEADLNVVEHLGSVQGYGSVVPERYQAATRSHAQGDLDPAVLASPLAPELRLAAVAVPTPNLLVAAGRSPAWTAAEGTQVGWWLGRGLEVADLRLETSGVPAGSALSVRLLDASGATVASQTARATRNGAVDVRLSAPVDASGVEVSSPALRSGAEVAVAVETANGQRWQPSRVGTALSPSRWRDSGQVVGMTLFQARHVDPPAWTSDGARVTEQDRSVTGDDRFRLAPGGPTTLVRSATFAPGWEATVHLTSGAALHRPVVADGILQSVRLPAGATSVTFHYRAPWLEPGLAISALALLGVAASLAVGLRGPRRRATRPAR